MKEKDKTKTLTSAKRKSNFTRHEERVANLFILLPMIGFFIFTLASFGFGFYQSLQTLTLFVKKQNGFGLKTIKPYLKIRTLEMLHLILCTYGINSYWNYSRSSFSGLFKESC